MKSDSRPKDYPVFLSAQRLEFVARTPSTHKQVLTIYNIYNMPVAFNILATNPNLFNVRDTRGIIQPQCCTDVLIRAQDFRAGVSAGGPGEAARYKLRVQMLSHSGSGGGVGGVLGYRDVECVMRLSEDPAAASASSAAAASSSSSSFAEPIGGCGGLREDAVGGLGSRRIVGVQAPQPQPAAPASPGGNLPITVTLGLVAVCVVLLALPLHQQHQPPEDRQGQPQTSGSGQVSASEHWFWSLLNVGGWNSGWLAEVSASHHVKLVAAYALGLLTAALMRYN